MQSILAIPPGFGVNLLTPKIGRTARLNEPYWLMCLVLISELEVELFIDLIHMLCYLVWGIIFNIMLLIWGLTLYFLA